MKFLGLKKIEDALVTDERLKIESKEGCRTVFSTNCLQTVFNLVKKKKSYTFIADGSGIRVWEEVGAGEYYLM